MITHRADRSSGTGNGHRAWPWAAVLAAALIAGLLALLAPATPASAADDGGFAARMLELLNQQRTAAGVAPVQSSPSLASIASDGQYNGCGFAVQGRAADMGVRNYFSHTILGCGTQSVFNVLGALGIQSSGSGENIAWMSGTTDPLVAAERLMNDLMASPGHKANILNPDFNTVGIGSWHTETGQSWTGGGTPLTRVYIGVQLFAHMTTTTPPPPPPPALPGAPTNVRATGGDASIVTTWDPAASGSAVDSYGVFAWNGAGYSGQYVTACATCATATVKGLVNGGAYYVTVYGHNAAGWGDPGYSGWVTVAAVPGAPTNVHTVSGNASVTTTWRGPTNPGTAIDGYAVFAFDANGYTNQYAWVCATCTTGTVTGLVNGRSYYSLVYAHNPNGWGTPTVSESVVAGTPGSPTNVNATRGNGMAGVTWGLAGSSGPAIDLYAVFVYDATGYAGIYATACSTCTSATVTGLTNGRTYTVWVYAHNAVGWGTPVASNTFTPAA